MDNTITIGGGGSTFSINLDIVDLNLLPTLRSHRIYSSVPLWSAPSSDRGQEYCEFEVRVGHNETDRDGDIDEGDGDMDEEFESMPVTRCHLCAVDVPAACWEPHTGSARHRACSTIARRALHRSAKQLSVSMPPPTPAAPAPAPPARFCPSCCACVPPPRSRAHDASRTHRRARLRDTLLAALADLYQHDHTATAAEDTLEQIKNIITAFENGTEASLDEHEDNQTKDFEDIKDNVEAAIDLNEHKENKTKDFEDIKTAKHKVSKEKLNKSVIPGKHVIINAKSGAVLKVPSDNYEGFYQVGDKTQCRVCRILVDNKEMHIFDKEHMRKRSVKVNDKNCIRMLDEILSHCILCNEIIENSEFHLLFSDTHPSLLQEALLQDDKIVTVDSYTEEIKADHFIQDVKFNEELFYCNVCHIYIMKANLREHILADSHKNRLDSLSAKDKKAIKALGNVHTVDDVKNKKKLSWIEKIREVNKEWRCKNGETIHCHMSPTNSIDKVACKVCKTEIDKTVEAMKLHVDSSDHQTKYEEVLEVNFIKKDHGEFVKCFQCNVQVVSNHALSHTVTKKHIRNMKSLSNAGITQPQDETEFKELLQSHKIENFNVKQYQCKICNKAFLKTHIFKHIAKKTHSRVLNLLSQSCGSNIANVGLSQALDDAEIKKFLQKHRIEDHNEKYYHCKMCYLFIPKQNALNHVSNKDHLKIFNQVSHSCDSNSKPLTVSAVATPEISCVSNQTSWAVSTTASTSNSLNPHYTPVEQVNNPLLPIKGLHYLFDLPVPAKPYMIRCIICDIEMYLSEMRLHQKDKTHKQLYKDILERNTMFRVKHRCFCECCMEIMKVNEEYVHITSALHCHKLNSLTERLDKIKLKEIATKMFNEHVAAEKRAKRENREARVFSDENSWEDIFELSTVEFINSAIKKQDTGDNHENVFVSESNDSFVTAVNESITVPEQTEIESTDGTESDSDYLCNTDAASESRDFIEELVEQIFLFSTFKSEDPSNSESSFDVSNNSTVTTAVPLDSKSMVITDGIIKTENLTKEVKNESRVCIAEPLTEVETEIKAELEYSERGEITGNVIESSDINRDKNEVLCTTESINTKQGQASIAQIQASKTEAVSEGERINEIECGNEPYTADANNVSPSESKASFAEILNLKKEKNNKHVTDSLINKITVESSSIEVNDTCRKANQSEALLKNTKEQHGVEMFFDTSLSHLFEKGPNPKQMICKICHCPISYRSDLVREHTNGLRHKANYENFLKVNQLKEALGNLTFHCSVCNVYVSRSNMFEHIRDTKHKLNAMTKPSTSGCSSNITGVNATLKNTENISAEKNTQYEIKSNTILATPSVTSASSTSSVKENNWWFCDVCNVKVTSNPKQIQAHCSGSRHKQYIEQLSNKGQPKTNTLTVQPVAVPVSKTKPIENGYCNVCKVKVTENVNNIREHSLGNLHQHNLKKQREESKNSSANNANLNVNRPPPKINGPIIDGFCSVCKVKVPENDRNINEHLKGNFHKQNLVTKFTSVPKINLQEAKNINSASTSSVGSRSGTPATAKATATNSVNQQNIETTTPKYPIENGFCRICNVEVDIEMKMNNIITHLKSKLHNDNVKGVGQRISTTKSSTAFSSTAASKSATPEPKPNETVIIIDPNSKNVNKGFCTVCKLHLSNNQNVIQQHIKGMTHRHNLTITSTSQSQKSETSKRPAPVEVLPSKSQIIDTNIGDDDCIQNGYCNICKVQVPNNAYNIQDHLKGNAHKKKIASNLSKSESTQHTDDASSARSENLNPNTKLEIARHETSQHQNDNEISNEQSNSDIQEQVTINIPSTDVKISKKSKYDVNIGFCRACNVDVGSDFWDIVEHVKSAAHNDKVKGNANQNVNSSETIQEKLDKVEVASTSENITQSKKEGAETISFNDQALLYAKELVAAMTGMSLEEFTSKTKGIAKANIPLSSSNVYKCDICKKEMPNNPHTVKDHMESKKHQNNAKKIQSDVKTTNDLADKNNDNLKDKDVKADKLQIDTNALLKNISKLCDLKNLEASIHLKNTNSAAVKQVGQPSTSNTVAVKASINPKNANSAAVTQVEQPSTSNTAADNSTTNDNSPPVSTDMESETVNTDNTSSDDKDRNEDDDKTDDGNSETDKGFYICDVCERLVENNPTDIQSHLNSFHHKSKLEEKQEIESELAVETHFCEICKCTVKKNAFDINKHNESQRHENNMQTILEKNKIKVRGDRICYCELCDLYFSKFSVTTHIQTVKHKNKLT